MWENLNIALKSLNGIILLIIYLRSTTGLTDTIINELSGSFIESGIPISIKSENDPVILKKGKKITHFEDFSKPSMIGYLPVSKKISSPYSRFSQIRRKRKIVEYHFFVLCRHTP